MEYAEYPFAPAEAAFATIWTTRLPAHCVTT